MKKLYLVPHVRIQTKRGPLSTFVESAKQTWERLGNGDYLLNIEGEADEVLLPASSVAYEQRARTTAKK